MRVTRVLFILFVVALVAAASLLLLRRPHEGGAAAVAMDGTAFSPAELTVAVGDTVVWTNKDPFPHNVTSESGGFHSADLDEDQIFRFQATRAGRFPYVCTLHPGMRGTLVVRSR